MPVFEYKGQDIQGQPVSGTIYGSSLASAADELAKKGLSVEHIGAAAIHSELLPPRPEGPGKLEASAAPPVDPSFAPRSTMTTEILGPLMPVPLHHLLFFFRQLATMLNAGVNPVQALDTIGSQTSDNRLRAAIGEFREHARAGRPLSVGMERYPEIFSPVMLSLVRIGEQTGTLDKSLKLAAQYTDREIELRSLYRRLTFYPKLVLGASILIILFANGVIAFLGKSGGISSPLTNPVTWIFLGPLLVLGFLFFRVGVRRPGVRQSYDEALQVLPYLGKTLHQIAMAKFGRAFGALYSAGVPLHVALRMAADACGNEYIRLKMLPAAKGLEEGAGFAESLAATGAFSPIVLDMARTGETTGNLDMMLEKVSEFYEEESRTRSTQMAYVFFVACILAVGVYVAYIVINFYMGYAAGFSAGM